MPAEKAQAASADNLFANADVTYTVQPNSDGAYEITYTGAPVAMGVASIVDRYTGEVYTPTSGDWSDPENDYIVRYVEDTNNNGKLDKGDTRLSGSTVPTNVGNYFVVAMNENAAANFADATMDTFANGDGYVAQYFKIVPRSLEGAVAVDGVVGDTEFTYNGGTQDVQFAVDGSLLDPDTDYDVTFVKVGTGSVAAVTDAGNYVATLVDTGAYQNSTVEVPFTVNKLNLETAAFYTPDLTEQSFTSISSTDEYSKTTVNGGASLQALMDASEVSVAQTSALKADGDTITTGNPSWQYYNFAALVDANTALNIGRYFFTATAVADNPNVEGEGTFYINVCDNLVNPSAFKYDGVQMNDGIATVASGELNGAVFNLAKGEAYDASLISVDGYKPADYTVSLSTDEAATPGKHTVVVSMNVPANFSIGGSSQATFTTIAGEIDTNTVDAVAIIDGVNVPFGSTYTTTYTGEAVVPAITVSCEGNTLTAGTDYTVTYTDAQGNPVDEMVNAGTYTVTIASDTYVISGAKSFTVQINKRGLNVSVVQPVEDSSDAQGILYTGSAIDPQFVGTYTVNGKDFQVTLDPSWYLLSGLKYMAPEAEKYSPATEVLEAGDYQVNISPTDKCINYTWAADNDVHFRVVETSFYTDVAADQWYADEVYNATVQGYINGVGDTKLFMPDNAIDRAALAQVMFNMAGKDVDPNKTYPTKFSDVPADAWFAQPVSWATEAGVVYGIGDTGTYAPYDNATREQVATMFYRYAKAQGMDVSGVADLSGYTDAASVSDWAEQAVAWAVETGIFGQGTDVLRPQDNISRAEVAAMAIRLQPVKLSTADIA